MTSKQKAAALLIYSVEFVERISESVGKTGH